LQTSYWQNGSRIFALGIFVIGALILGVFAFIEDSIWWTIGYLIFLAILATVVFFIRTHIFSKLIISKNGIRKKCFNEEKQCIEWQSISDVKVRGVGRDSVYVSFVTDSGQELEIEMSTNKYVALMRFCNNADVLTKLRDSHSLPLNEYYSQALKIMGEQTK